MVPQLLRFSYYPRWLVAVVFISLAGACDAISSIGGNCHDPSDGAVLEQVRDANGDLFSVKKVDVKFFGETIGDVLRDIVGGGSV